MWQDEEYPDENRLPAVIYEPTRHPLMVKEEKEYIADIKKELEIDEQLGLKNQALIDQHSALEKDIDELTNSKDYYEISKKQLGELFSLPALKRKVFFINIMSSLSGFLSSIKPYFYGWYVANLIAIPFLLKWSIFFADVRGDDFLLALSFVGNIICWAGWLFSSIGSVVTTLANTTFKFSTLKVDINIKEISRSEIKIPYGAKLKTLEAQESKIFENFVIARPDLKVEHSEFRPRMTFDPAILGITADKRMFMICYWDIKHDVERVVKKIDRFKKFKIEA